MTNPLASVDTREELTSRSSMHRLFPLALDSGIPRRRRHLPICKRRALVSPASHQATAPSTLLTPYPFDSFIDWRLIMRMEARIGRRSCGTVEDTASLKRKAGAPHSTLPSYHLHPSWASNSDLASTVPTQYPKSDSDCHGEPHDPSLRHVHHVRRPSIETMTSSTRPT